MKSLLVAGVFCGALALTAGSAQAATANFQGNCTHNVTSVSCQFDPLRPAGSPSSCPGSFIWKVNFDYGDGTSSGLVSPASPVSHTYTSPLAGAYDVNLTVYCWDGNTPTKLRVLCLSFGVPGCIQANGTWN